MTLTIDELEKLFCAAVADEAFRVGHLKSIERAGIRAIVTALRDEIIPEKMRITHANDTCTRTSLRRYFHEILAPREGGSREAGGPTREDGRSVEQLAATSSHAVTAPATAPAPAPCLWRVHHETRNGPLYVSQCDGEWRHATADPKCPSCGKEIFFPTDPAPAVCEWAQRGRDEPGFYATPHGLCHINHLPRSGGCWCGKPIKFAEAK